MKLQGIRTISKRYSSAVNWFPSSTTPTKWTKYRFPYLYQLTQRVPAMEQQIRSCSTIPPKRSAATLAPQTMEKQTEKTSVLPMQPVPIQREPDTGINVPPMLGILEPPKQNHKVHEALRDSYGREHTYLRLSLTEKCNLRCLYCMPEEGVPLTPSEKLLTIQEIDRLTNLFVALGVNKIRLTGGEPTVRKDFDEIVSVIGNVDGVKTFGVTSNGIVLRRKLEHLAKNGVTRLNISLDTLDPAKFERITRRPGIHLVLESINAALRMTDVFDPVKINSVVMRGVNDDELGSFVEILRRQPKLQTRFIEYMPFDGNQWNEPKFIPYQEMKTKIEEHFQGEKMEKYVEKPAIPPMSPSLLSQPPTKASAWAHKTAKLYAMPSLMGKIGFVSSMSENFCGGCTRLRITADGNLKVCLFGKSEVSLRDAMRIHKATDDDLIALIDSAVKRKHFSLGGNKDRFQIATQPNRPMISIGG